MALFQELTGQGRVVGGHLSSGTVVVGGATGFSKNSDLAIQHSSNPFKRHRINAETVIEWEELDPKEGVGGAIGRAAATAAIPGRVGKAVGAGLGAAMNSGNPVRISWADGKQSIIALPEKQFMVFSVLLKDRQTATEVPDKLVPEVPTAQPGVSERIADFALSAFSKGKQQSPSTEEVRPHDVTEQIARLGALHAQGVPDGRGVFGQEGRATQASLTPRAARTIGPDLVAPPSMLAPAGRGHDEHAPNDGHGGAPTSRSARRNLSGSAAALRRMERGAKPGPGLGARGDTS